MISSVFNYIALILSTEDLKKSQLRDIDTLTNTFNNITMSIGTIFIKVYQ